VPYKGLSLFLAYIAVPLFQIVLSSTFGYKAILGVFLALSFVSLYLGVYFYRKIQYVKHSDIENAKESKAREL
jgi:membrane protein implicated in regulation of membrane protease activity